MRDRKAFFQVIAKAHSSQDIVLIVPSAGCISTKYEEFNDIIQMLRENGIRVVSLKQPERMIFDMDSYLETKQSFVERDMAGRDKGVR